MAFDRDVSANAPAIGAAAVCKRVLRVIISILLESSLAEGRARLKEQILAPLRLAFSEHAHQMAAGMQAERLGLAGQFHAGLFGSAAALPVIATVAAGHQIFPGRFTGA